MAWNQQKHSHTAQHMHRTPLFHSNLRANFQRHLTLLRPSLTKNSPLRPPTPPAHGKNIPVPPRTYVSIQFATKQRCAARLRVLGPRDAGTTASRRECPGWARGIDMTLVQSPEHGEVGGEESWEEQSGSSVWGSGLCRAGCANETASGPRSLAGHGSDRCGPIAKWDSGRFGLSPHPSPGDYKRKIVEPSTLFFTCLPCSLLHLSALPSSSLLLVVCPSLDLHSWLVCNRRSSGTSAEHTFPQPRQSD